jgi:DNA-binding NtrC family response regulator
VRATGAAPAGDTTSDAALERVKREMWELERQRVVDALNQHAGNQTRAARSLGISRRTLLKRLDAYALPRPRKD